MRSVGASGDRLMLKAAVEEALLGVPWCLVRFAEETNDQTSATDEQVFPDYDAADPEPVYD